MRIQKCLCFGQFAIWQILPALSTVVASRNAEPAPFTSKELLSDLVPFLFPQQQIKISQPLKVCLMTIRILFSKHGLPSRYLSVDIVNRVRSWPRLLC